MIGHAVVGEIIGADLFGAVAGADLFAAHVGDVPRRFQLFDLVKFCAEDVHRFFAVCELRALLARSDDDTGWFVENAYGGLYFVHVLSAGAARTRKCHLKIIRDDVYGLGLDDRQYGNGGRRSMHTSRPFGCRNALDSMDAGFIFECFINAFAFYFRNERFVALKRRFIFVENREIPAALRSVALVHAREVARKDGGFIAARPAADFQNNLICHCHNPTIIALSFVLSNNFLQISYLCTVPVAVTCYNRPMNESAWYKGLKKPSWAPPAKIFAPVWTVLYVIITWSFAFAFYGIAVGLFPLIVGLPFTLNLIFNFAFMPIEFRFKNNVVALVDVLLTLGTLIWALVEIFPFWAPIAIINVPYLVWLVFASSLQIAIVAKNRRRS